MADVVKRFCGKEEGNGGNFGMMILLTIKGNGLLYLWRWSLTIGQHRKISQASPLPWAAIIELNGEDRGNGMTLKLQL